MSETGELLRDGVSAPWWSTACPDWRERIVERRSLIPFDPLFPAEAEAALEIFRGLRVVDVPGRPRMEEICRPWVLDLVAAIFGAYDPDIGRRLIRYFFLLIAKKNTKSTTAAGIMLTALLRNWRESGEYYILAPTKEVADNSFFPARDMVLADEEVQTLLHVQPNHRLITHRNTGAFLKVVSADSETVSGKKTIGLLIDELWLFGKRANAGAMLREAMGGLASRPEGFVMGLSTQGDGPPAGVFDEWLKKYRAIRDGELVDPRSFGLLYEFPEAMIESGAYREPRNFYIPNPNLGASVDEQFLLEQLAEDDAKGQAALVGFYAKYLNVQPGMAMRANGWAGQLVWSRGVESGLTLDAVIERSEVLTVGIDGGGLDDLLGLAVIGREKGRKRWLSWTHALISDIGMERRKANATQYDQFEQDGDLTKFVYVAPAGDDSDDLAANLQFIVDVMIRIRDSGKLAHVGVDAAGIGAIVDVLDGIGITQDADLLSGVKQGIGLMGAAKTLEIKLAEYSFRHAGSRMMAWCVGNAVVVPTPTAMRVARDESGFGKIDPLMALFNAAALMSLNPEAGEMFDEDYQLPVWA